MTKEQKSESEIRHRKVQRFLESQLPGCEVRYDGVEGVDHTIMFNGKKTIVETKTCNRIEKCGIDRKRTRSSEFNMLFEKFHLGRMKFWQAEGHPYTESQHDDIVSQDGWYIFVVGHDIIGGISAKELDNYIGGKWTEKRVTWSRVIGWCHPDWLKKLKERIYF